MSWIAAAVVGSAAIGAGSAYLSGEQQADALESAAAESRKGANLARSELYSQFDPSLSAIQTGFAQGKDYLTADTPAAQLEAALTGALGPVAQAEAYDAFATSPGTTWLAEQQEQALLRNASAIGGLGGGNVRSALQEQAFGRAATTSQQAIQNLASIAGREQTTQSNLANLAIQGALSEADLRSAFGSSMANLALGESATQSNLLTQIGSTQAAQTQGIGSALQSMIGGLAGAYGAGSVGATAGSQYGSNYLQPLATTSSIFNPRTLSR